MFADFYTAPLLGTVYNMPQSHMWGLWLLAFLIGGIPFGYIAGKLNGIDIRREGSGNIGATNVFRVIGRRWGISVFVLDFLKALLPLTFFRHYLTGGELPLEPDLFLLIAGVLTVVGHNYSPYLGFKGGKGMATSAGFLAGLVPWSLLVCFSAWLIVFLSTRYVSLASIVAGVALPVGTLFIYPSQVWLITASFFLGGMSVWRHRSNIRNLRAGTEHRFSKSKSDKDSKTLGE